MYNKVVVVIPIHKSNPTENELRSFVQCFKVLGNHPIKVLAPEGLNCQKYKDSVEDFEIQFIDKKWLSSIKEYNKLKTSLFFYGLFKEYEFLVTYEIDAWVFRDELGYWCNKGFDYIGAPWFEGWHEAKGTSKIIGVGNSGFSLRNVHKAIAILKRIKRIRSYRRFWYKSKFQAAVRFENLLKYFPTVHSKNKLAYLLKILSEGNRLNEDIFWSVSVPAVFNDFNVSDIDNSIKFSFEVNPSLLFKKNNCKLPFGCHAWEKYEPEFWRKYIPDQKNNYFS